MAVITRQHYVLLVEICANGPIKM